MIFVVVSATSYFLLYGPFEREIVTLGPRDEIERIRDELGLNDPWYEGYARWLGNAVRGDLGEEYRSERPIGEEFRRRLPPTVEITVIAVIVAIASGWLFAALVGMMRRRQRELVLTFAAILSALPIGFTLLLIIIVPSVWWSHSYPVGGYVSILDDPVRNVHLFGPPSFTLGIAAAAVAMLVYGLPHAN
ncbi:MAG: hypothetical protein WD359_06555, partial [Dehalococcoidia bacterium]